MRLGSLRHTSLFLLLCCIANVCLASTLSKPVDLLSVYQEALAYDSEVGADIAAFRASKSVVKQRWSDLLPNVNLSANSFDNRQHILETQSFSGGMGTGPGMGAGSSGTGATHFNSHGYTLDIKQPIYRFDRWMNLRKAKQESRQADVNLSAEIQNLMVKVAERYFDVLSANSTLEFTQAETRAIAKELERAKQRFEVGAIAINDVHEAQAEYDLARADEIRAQNDLDNAYAALKEVTGITYASLAVLNENADLLPPQPEEINLWVDTAMQNNLEIQSAAYAKKIAREELRVRRAGHHPSLDLVSNYSYTSTGGRFGGFESKDEKIGFEVTVPIFQSGSVVFQSQEAKHRLEQADQQLLTAQRSAERQTRESYLGVLSTMSRAQALKQAVISNQSALEVTQAGYEVGTRNFIDVLTVQSALFQAFRDHAAERHSYVVNTLKLKQAAGTLSEGDLEEVNSWLQKSWGKEAYAQEQTN